MRDNDFSSCPSTSGKARSHKSNLTHQASHHNNDPGLCLEASNQINEGNNDSSAAHHHHQYVTGSQLVAMSSSAPTGHLIRTPSGAILDSNGTKIEPMQFSQHQLDSSSMNGLMGQGGGLDLASSPNTRTQILMTRVPVILNSLSPTAQASSSGLSTSYQNCASPTSVSSSSYSRHRELHKTLEKNRRAHLRHCFELLKSELPTSEYVDKKTSHINIIKSAIKYVLILRQQESELENELQRLAQIKHQLTEKMSSLRGRQLHEHHPRYETSASLATLSSAAAAVIDNHKNEDDEDNDEDDEDEDNGQPLSASVAAKVVASLHEAADRRTKRTAVKQQQPAQNAPNASEGCQKDESKTDLDKAVLSVGDNNLSHPQQALDGRLISAEEVRGESAQSQSLAPADAGVGPAASASSPSLPTAVTGSPESSPRGDDLQSASETKMLLNCLADKLSLK